MARNQLKRRLKNFIFFAIVLYVFIGVLLYVFQEKFLFLPSTLEADYSFQFESNFEELFFETEDNVSINALHFKTENPRTKKGVILYFHGNAGDLSRWGKYATYFVEKGYDVLMIDYRTYGKSKGELSEKAIYKDAQYAYDFLLKNFKESEIIIYGRSLGTGIASYLAAHNSPKQLILETPYYSIPDVAKGRFPIYPVGSLLKYEFPTYQYLPKVHCPVAIFHGTEDRVVPFGSARKLQNLGINDLDFVTIEGGSHNDLSLFDDYHQTMNVLLK